MSRPSTGSVRRGFSAVVVVSLSNYEQPHTHYLVVGSVRYPVLVLFDGTVSGISPDNRPETALAIFPAWNPTGSSTLHVIGISGIGQGLEDDQHRHGLFTYYLLRALCGEGDTNRDGDVTLGETVAYLSQKVRWASKTRMNQGQRPFTAPAISPTDPSAVLILTKQAAIQGTEAN